VIVPGAGLVSLADGADALHRNGRLVGKDLGKADIFGIVHAAGPRDSRESADDAAFHDHGRSQQGANLPLLNVLP